MQLYEAIEGRRSVSQLGPPVPGHDVLARVFAAAGRAPDHRVLRPWRYLVIEGDAALRRLGDLFLAGMRSVDPERAERDAVKLQNMPLRAPMIIVAVLRLQDHPGVPAWEQWLSLGASVQNLLLALHGEGYAAMWRTGDVTGLDQVRHGLGLAGNEQIGGFVYVGTALAGKAPPPQPEGLWQAWTGA